jgi:hypothetical protein
MTEEQIKKIRNVAQQWFIYCDIAEDPASEITVDDFKYATYAQLVYFRPNMIEGFSEEAYNNILTTGEKISDLVAKYDEEEDEG